MAETRPVPLTIKPVVTGLARDDAKLLASSVLLEETTPPRVLRLIVGSLTLLLISFIVWASVSQFAEKAIASGEILPSGRIQEIQYPETGRVSEIHVSEGQRVEVGDILISLDQAEVREQFERLETQERTVAIDLERARAYAENRSPSFTDVPEKFTEFLNDQNTALANAVENRSARLALFEAQVAVRQRELESLAQEIEALEREATSLEEARDIRQQLQDQGSGSRVALLTAEREYSAALAGIAEKRTELERTQAQEIEAQARLQEARQDLSNDAFAEVTRLNADYLEVAERLAGARDRLERTILRAPVAGLVSGMTISRSQEVVQAGETIMTILPTDEELVAEVRLSPKDVGHVKVGMPVFIRVESYKYGKLGGVDGVVREVSVDTFEDADNVAYFRTLITLDKNYVGLDPEANLIISGMAVSAQIRTGEKSLVAYLMRPVSQSLERTFTER